MLSVDGWQCQRGGTVHCDGLLSYKYTVNVTFFEYAGCKQWEESLNELQSMWAEAIFVATEELTDGVMYKAELQNLIDKYGEW